MRLGPSAADACVATRASALAAGAPLWVVDRMDATVGNTYLQSAWDVYASVAGFMNIACDDREAGRRGCAQQAAHRAVSRAQNGCVSFLAAAAACHAGMYEHIANVMRDEGITVPAARARMSRDDEAALRVTLLDRTRQRAAMAGYPRGAVEAVVNYDLVKRPFTGPSRAFGYIPNHKPTPTSQPLYTHLMNASDELHTLIKDSFLVRLVFKKGCLHKHKPELDCVWAAARMAARVTALLTLLYTVVYGAPVGEVARRGNARQSRSPQTLPQLTTHRRYPSTRPVREAPRMRIPGLVNSVNGVNGVSNVQSLNSLNSLNGATSLKSLKSLNGATSLRSLKSLNGATSLRSLKSLNSLRSLNSLKSSGRSDSSPVSSRVSSRVFSPLSSRNVTHPSKGA
jgi:hypothetical protein